MRPFGVESFVFGLRPGEIEPTSLEGSVAAGTRDRAHKTSRRTSEMGSGLIAREPRAHRSWLALCTGLVLAVCFALSAAPAFAATDWDGDGSTDSDCAPLDPAVHPGAADKPDLAFEDTNCDGIDGDKANAIFVTPTAANNNGIGSITSPKATLNGTNPSSLGAIAAAKAANKDVY